MRLVVGSPLTDSCLYVRYRRVVNNGTNMAGRLPKYARLVAELMEEPAVLDPSEIEGMEPPPPKI